MSKIIRYLSIIVSILFFISVIPSLLTNIKKQYAQMLLPHANVGVVTIKKSIDNIDDYSKQLHTYFEDPSVKAILLEIDSPGGNAGSSNALFLEILNLKKEHPKPVVALSLDMCASAAYLLACTADYIITSPAAIVGSIGASISFFNFSEVLKKYNVDCIERHGGKYKTIGSPFLPSTPDMNNMLQTLADNSYAMFTRDVANCRSKLALSELEKWASGKIFTGQQALEIGLVDENGSKFTATKKIKELAQIGDDIEINWLKQKDPNAISRWLDDRLQSNFSLDRIIDATVGKLGSNLVTSN